MDKDIIRLTAEYLKKLYELTIKCPDDHVDCSKINTACAVDDATAKRIMLFLESQKLILHSKGCVTITMKGMDKVIEDDINKYISDLENTIDATYYSQFT